MQKLFLLNFKDSANFKSWTFMVEHPNQAFKCKRDMRNVRKKAKKSKIRNNGKLIHYQIVCLEWFPKIFGNDEIFEKLEIFILERFINI